MSVPVAPGRWLVLGHTPALLKRRFGFTEGLRAHGDVVRVYLGMLPMYFVTTPELTHRVLVADSASFGKGAMFDKFRPFVGNGLVNSGGPFHLRQRRLVQPAFHHERIARYAEKMEIAVSRLSESWRPGEQREINEDMQALAVTIVGEALFGTEFGRTAIGEARYSIPIVIRHGMVRALSPAFVGPLLVRGNRQFDRAVRRMRAVVGKVITDWRATGADRGDLLSMLLMARDEDGEPMTDQQAYDEVVTLLSAGIETSALALAWLFHEIARHPEVERRVHEEIDQVLSGRRVTADDVPKLTYLQQVVNETLRMYPVWILMRRTLRPVRLGGVALPAGTEVTISPHALHHDPRCFPDPRRFDPDRWTPDRAKEVPRGAFIPFGAGNRMCVGNAFALTEMVVTVATIASRWRLVPVPERPLKVTFTSTAYPARLSMTAVPR
ncbi:cytochrome P450 [Actinophytocola algeriensis]|uniref:Cytochrome P450 n=1 Tax=Actinophytocola algeriensis TaxID=1768010 RepID=A0A7W7VBX2_9PSEU|nr:cytochrome P450 [Actinophytocola algeriensis]MBB4904422.1 cytochrome P450 [Actinophytocola algeriensis]MBE1476719.1 cytochrome P450 [Actinophytocola algeriensis]